MKLARLLCSLALLAFPSWLAAEPPQVIEPQVERNQGPPLWISAEAVADSEKVVNLDLVDSLSLSRSVEKQNRTFQDARSFEMLRTGDKPPVVEIPYSECKSMLATFDHRGGEAPGSTLSDLATHSRSIVLGTIASVARGFSFGTPASLLEVEIHEVVKGRAPGPRIYVDYLVARFRIGPYYFCNANKGYEPSPGDRILVFDYAGPVDRTGSYYAPRQEQLFFESRSGALAISPQLKNDPELKDVTSLDQVLGRLRSEARGALTRRSGA